MTKPRQEFFYKEPNEKRTTKSHEKLKFCVVALFSSLIYIGNGKSYIKSVVIGISESAKSISIYTSSCVTIKHAI
jgi:hypothetical protein